MTNSRTWAYSKGNWAKFFETVNLADENAPLQMPGWGENPLGKQKYLQFVYNSLLPHQTNKSLHGVPQRVVTKLGACHENLPAWFAGILSDYAMRPTEHLQNITEKYYNEARDKLLKDVEDYIAIQIRSTDKKSEATLLDSKVYFEYLEVMSKVVQGMWEMRTVWIATDDPQNVNKFRSACGDSYQVYSLYDLDYFSKPRHYQRYSEKGVEAFAVEMKIMREAKYFIGF